MSEDLPHVASADPDGSRVRVLLETPIHFDVPGGTVHSPMVEATVAEIHTRLILDTGSTAHVLTRDLAAGARLESQAADPGTDHTGAPVWSGSLGAVPIEVAGFRLDLQDVQAIEGPPAFEQWGIGGFLSPQGLDKDAWTVIDLVENRLMLVGCDGPALAAWLQEHFPALHRLSLKRERGDAVRIRASIEPFPTTVALLNTGTPDTEFVRAALPGLEGTQTQGAGLGVSGAEVTGAHVAGRVLRVGDWTGPVKTLFIRHERAPEHPDGQIGMDVLSGTVLAISPHVDRPVCWMVPHRPGRLRWTHEDGWFADRLRQSGEGWSESAAMTARGGSEASRSVAPLGGIPSKVWTGLLVLPGVSSGFCDPRVGRHRVERVLGGARTGGTGARSDLGRARPRAVGGGRAGLVGV